MKATPLPILLILCLSNVSLHAQGNSAGVIDLLNLYDYAGQEVPAYINRDNTPAGDPITNTGATLGRVLFYDKRLSRNDTVSCSSCHQQAHGFSDLSAASAGVAGTTGRHSMRLINARFSAEPRFFWDERATSLEDQTSQPIQDHVEMGFSGADGDPGLGDLAAKLGALEEYQVLFQAVYGDAGVTEDRIQRVLAQFVRSIQSFDSKFDDGRAQVANDAADFPNFTASENQGKSLFLTPPGPGGGAGCAGCHRAPEFDINPNSGNNGVTGSLGGGSDTTVTRSPSLRDLVGPDGSSNGGLMHTAEFASIEEVIEHYNAIPAVVEGLDPRLIGPGGTPQRLNLSANQKANLAAFLRTLSGDSVYSEPRWSNPFDENGSLSLVVLPNHGLDCQLSGAGSARVATISMRAVPNVDYVFQWSADLSEWGSLAVTADDAGMITVEIAAPAGDRLGYYRFAYLVD